MGSHVLKMFEKMSADGQKTREIGNSERPELKKEKTKTKKYVIIGVVSVIIATLILVGLLVGIYLFTDTFHKIVSESTQTKENTNQDTNVDQTANIIEYNVQDNGVSAIFVDDYNMYLSVVKLTTANDVVCYATPMNESQKTDLTKINSRMDQNVEGNAENTFVKSKVPIPDISFLNRKTRSMCKGISTYWAYPVCASPNASSKQRRGLCKKICTYACKWIKGKLKCGDYCWVADVICTLFG